MILEELMIANPKISVVLISFLVTLAMTIVTKNFTDQTRMKELKAIQKEYQKTIKENKDDMDLQKRVQADIMKTSMELMKHSFRPLMVTFLPLILIFWWIRGVYLETAISTSWLWWYIGASLVSSIFLRKALDVV
jgi:uncharacterized membrane protein (DUF106 family)|tara:strand:+ start:41 stop:445 length:405 start_codon:yes stop_codon:yes gene_type:complete